MDIRVPGDQKVRCPWTLSQQTYTKFFLRKWIRRDRDRGHAAIWKVRFVLHPKIALWSKQLHPKAQKLHLHPGASKKHHHPEEIHVHKYDFDPVWVLMTLMALRLLLMALLGHL